MLYGAPLISPFVANFGSGDGGGVSERSSPETGRESPRDDFRFSDRVFARTAVAFAVVPVQVGGVVDTGRPCTAATMDNEGRFSFSGFKVGVRSPWVLALPTFALSHILIVQDPGEQGAKAPCSPLSLHCRIVALPISHFPLSIFRCRAYRRKLSGEDGEGGGRGGRGDRGEGGGRGCHCRFPVVVPTGGSCLVRLVTVVAVVSRGSSIFRCPAYRRKLSGEGGDGGGGGGLGDVGDLVKVVRVVAVVAGGRGE